MSRSTEVNLRAMWLRSLWIGSAVVVVAVVSAAGCFCQEAALAPPPPPAQRAPRSQGPPEMLTPEAPRSCGASLLQFAGADFRDFLNQDPLDIVVGPEDIDDDPLLVDTDMLQELDLDFLGLEVESVVEPDQEGGAVETAKRLGMDRAR